MPTTYYTILTNIGLAKLANAEVTGTKVLITQIAVGDGGGSPVTPTQDMTELVNEVWRDEINLLDNHPEHPNWVVAEGMIPTGDGGFYIREVGLFDSEGDMVAVGNYPETYKPSLPEGSGQDLYLRLIMAVGNVSVVQLKIDPTLIIATRKYVDDEIDEHDADPEAHPAIQTKIGTDISTHNSNAAAHTAIQTKIGTDIGTHNADAAAHPAIRSEIDSDISTHNSNAAAHTAIQTKIGTDIGTHNADANAHPAIRQNWEETIEGVLFDEDNPPENVFVNTDTPAVAFGPSVDSKVRFSFRVPDAAKIDVSKNLVFHMVYSMSTAVSSKKVSMNITRRINAGSATSVEDEITVPNTTAWATHNGVNLKIATGAYAAGDIISCILWRDVDGVAANHTGDFQLIKLWLTNE